MQDLIFRMLRLPPAVQIALKHLYCVHLHAKLERQSNDLHFLQLSVIVYLLIKEGVPGKSCRSWLIWKKGLKILLYGYYLLAHACQPSEGIH